MRLAHLADCHLGARLYHRAAPGGFNQREQDVADAFDRAIDDVIAQAPDVVLVAGDLFHRVAPTNTATLAAYRGFRRLREALPDAPVILIAGNHDAPRATETGSPLTLLAELGLHIATDRVGDFAFPALDLVVRAVPHPALLTSQPGDWSGAPTGAGTTILMVHGEAEGVFTKGEDEVEYGGAFLPRFALVGGGWSYVALGHYHVAHEIGPMCWYAGATDYVSSNVWGELRDEVKYEVQGKGWLLVDLDYETVEHRPVRLNRRFLELEPVAGDGLTAAELDQAIAARVAAAEPIDGQIVRLRVEGVERATQREMNHAVLRALQTRALDFRLDIRRPEVRTAGGGVSGRSGKPLEEMLADFLAKRAYPADVDPALIAARGKQMFTEASEAYLEAIGKG